ncbi:hypothetical protein AAMO2058_001311400 [Amorphochlora amoebiformis]
MLARILRGQRAGLKGFSPLIRTTNFATKSNPVCAASRAFSNIPSTVTDQKTLVPESEAQTYFNSKDGYFESYQLPPLEPSDKSQRNFVYFVSGGSRVFYASAARLAVMKIVASLSASADVLALGQTEVDISKIEVGSSITVKFRGKPVFVKHRTQEEIDAANQVTVSDLRHPEEDSARVEKPEWLIVLGVCTHLGCVPIPNMGAFNGYFCPCHGSHYDTSGRIRKGPAPLNLEVPSYSFATDTKLIIG